MGREPSASSRPKRTKRRSTPRRSAPESSGGFLAGSSRVLDSIWDWICRKAGDLGVYFDRQKRMAWCQRAAAELREDRDHLFMRLGEEVYASYAEGAAADGAFPATEELLEECRRIDELDAKVEAQELLRDRIAGEGQPEPAPKKRKKTTKKPKTAGSSAGAASRSKPAPE